jgi:3-hydroxyisobutyrate dehydrogenase
MTATDQQIAFIGLGNMGSGMAANLAKAGFSVSAFDLDPAAVAAVADAGVKAEASAAEAVRTAQVVITMLPAGQHVRQVVEESVLGGLSQGGLLIDCSTIDVATAREIAARAAEHGLAAVDAPVSGGVAAAQAGGLTFMVGGSEGAFTRAQPILSAMGKAVIHAGEAGAGQAAKICNNMLLAITMIGTCEAFAMAQRLGLDPQRFFDISSRASGQNWSMTSYCPVPGPVPQSPANRGYQPGFAGAMMLKDLKLALQAASQSGASIPLGAHAETLYQLFVNQGGATQDFSGIFNLISGSTEHKP